MDNSSLVKEFNLSRFVSSTSKKELASWIQTKNCIYLSEGGKITGIARFKILTHGWNEIGPVFLLSQLHGRGLGKSLFKDITRLASQNGVRVIATTRNPKVIKILTTLGYKRISILKLPLKILSLLLKKNAPTKIFAYLKKGILFYGWRTYLFNPNQV